MSFIKDLYNGVKDIFNGPTYIVPKYEQTDIECPKCHNTNLIRIIDAIGSWSIVCSNCGYSLNDSTRNNGGESPCAPTPMKIE